MRPTRATVLLTAGLVTLLGVPAAGAADTPANLYVNNESDSNCSDAGAGSQAVPFCTISAAAKLVKPGQTVRIKTWTTYDENVVIDRSGEPGKPITFTADTENFSSAAYLEFGRSLTVSGASHVVVRGLQSYGGVQVHRSTDVELDRLYASNDSAVGLVVGEGSVGVRATRSRLLGVRVEGGARGTVLGRNRIDSDFERAVDVVDAPETAVTNNTVRSGCGTTLSVRGTSSSSALFNNAILTWPVECASAEPSKTIEVAASATAGTRADYNLIARPDLKVTPYTWGGAGFQTPAAFAAATGQGAHDILTAKPSDTGTDDGSPTIDSGDPTAPGVLPTDIYGKPTADDPRVPNTGKDGGFIERGAVETQDVLKGVQLGLEPTWAPVGTMVKATAVPNSRWPAGLTYHYDFGDGTAPVVTKNTTAEHVYGKPGDYVAKVTAVTGVGEKVTSFDHPVKASAAGPLTAAFTAEQVLPTSSNPLSGDGPLTVSVDSTSTAAPWPVTGTDLDFGDGTQGHADDLRAYKHEYKLPGTYEVTVTVQDAKGAKSTAKRSVKVDYAPSGYVATEPFRLLDTRTTNTPVQGGYAQSVALPIGTRVLGHELSGSMASAVLNVTVTGATEDTHLSVWPAGQPRPVTSNVNVKAGGTSSNTVTVPVGADGKVAAQLNSGRASLIVDFVGYYQPNIGERFSPVTPTRVVDTRTAGGALGGGQTRTVKVAGVNGVPADATAVALNLTGTGATEQAHVIAYPDPAKRPATSNLNVEPGKDKSNQAIVPVGPNGTITLFTNSGSTHLVVDAVGYYGKDGKALFTPVVPKRLADTRTTGKLAPGATTTVAGLPANAVGAVLNVTATESTGPGFLTVHGFGTPRTDASSLNTLPGLTVPNHVTTPVGDGKVSVFNSWGGSNHVITDLLGYFTQG
ncbi:PKD domain-containing protein [Streptomyces sp. NBC_00555]|uniref:PKD domain-containing protein n=1 Tax=Streptomyces sp. NBC_00555 TaxID=2903662 RepID=UPI0022564AE8|nr:PKD domain-containing protein [Streptomyces sp. NBC_00555]MCX5012734.1 PKD domain-containing protein [Streptomyces sp. NBC_00555]